MEFRLSEPEPGSFQIVRMEPAVVGTFTDRATAEKIMGFLEMDAVNEARPRKVQAPAAIAPAEPKAAVAAPPAAPVKPARATPQSPATKEPAAAKSDWTTAELRVAFERLEAGEAIKDVAKSFDKSWQALRGRWAARRRAQQQSTELVPVTAPQMTPAEKVTSAVQALKDQEMCSLCERYFTPSAENPDRCARCSKDT